MSILIIGNNEKNAENHLAKYISEVEGTPINILNNIDIINCNRGDTILSTKEVRTLLSETSLKPNTLNSKYICFYNYDRVGERIQNMLLKTLEEGRVKILLHANSIANILPTTLSRVVVSTLISTESVNKKRMENIGLIIKDKQVSKVWDVKKENVNEFINSLETYLKENKPKNYTKSAKKIMLLKKRLLSGITLNKDIQLTNLFLDLL